MKKQRWVEEKFYLPDRLGWRRNVLRTLKKFMLLSWWCPLGPEKDTCRQDETVYRNGSIDTSLDPSLFSLDRTIPNFVFKSQCKLQYTLDNVQAGLIYVSCSHLQVNIGEWLRRSANMLDKYRSRDALLQNHTYTNVWLSLLFRIPVQTIPCQSFCPSVVTEKFAHRFLFLTVQREEFGSSPHNQPTNILPASVLYSLTRSHW